MKQMLFAIWAGVLGGVLYMSWGFSDHLLGFNAMDELKTQLEHIDDWMNNRGVYSGQHNQD
jgi:hypothetical protein